MYKSKTKTSKALDFARDVQMLGWYIPRGLSLALEFFNHSHNYSWWVWTTGEGLPRPLPRPQYHLHGNMLANLFLGRLMDWLAISCEVI